MAKGRLAPLLLLGLAASPLAGQVTARQGSHVDSRQSFRSPMVLEVPAGPLLALARGKSWSFPEVANFRCEDASFRSVTFKRTRAPQGELEYEVEGYLVVADSYDRVAAVRVDLVASNAVVASGHKDEIDAEERKTHRFWFKVEVDPGATAALGASPAPTVRLTLQLRRNGLF